MKLLLLSLTGDTNEATHIGRIAMCLTEIRRVDGIIYEALHRFRQCLGLVGIEIDEEGFLEAMQSIETKQEDDYEDYEYSDSESDDELATDFD